MVQKYPQNVKNLQNSKFFVILTASLASRVVAGYAPSATGGVQVTTVEAGSVAEAAGVKEGEQIVSVGGQPITTVDACAQMLAQGAGGSIILQLSSWKPVIQVFS